MIQDGLRVCRSGCSQPNQACSQGGVLKMGQGVCRLSPFPALLREPVCAAGMRPTLESLFRTVSMASDCSVLRGTASLQESSCLWGDFRPPSVGRCSWNLLGFCDGACAV
ncbi:hypothetical protein NPIL_527451 [Nephila pilipes]|uniref:Uncharacterized protein n=1 Tax=Nephila pilipes TaxID=299642 RepID=A0A8X6MHI6_NEPPI|nr:hypothetical protein NPIL_527451 [Nephila pilipes]